MKQKVAVMGSLDEKKIAVIGLGYVGLPNIKKVTSGSTPEAADLINMLHGEIITVGTHMAPSIKIAVTCI